MDPFSQHLESLQQFNLEPIEHHQPHKNISPESLNKNTQQQLFSPIHVADFSDPRLDHQEYFSNSFKRIMEQVEDQEMHDIMGNKIHQFSQEEEDEQYQQMSPIQDNKENQVPLGHLATPLKIRRLELRSPLQDITPKMKQLTPSMTQKKKKTNSKQDSMKNRFLTPRTMQKSGLATSGLRRIQRF